MSPLLAFWRDDLDPFLIRFGGNFGIRYYGLAYAAGFLVSAWLLHAYARRGRSLLGPDKIGDFMLYVVAGVVIGGRVGSYLLYGFWRNFPADPFALFRVWEGGMSFHGGLVGAIIAVAFFARGGTIPLRHLWDVLASTAPVGLFFGRIANFINGELWGKPTTVPWAVLFPRSAYPETDGPLMPRHPSQLYEAGMEGVLLFIYLQWRLRTSDVVREKPGRLGGEFLLLYGVARIAGEVFREPDTNVSLLLGLSRGTFYSLFMVAAGVTLALRPGAPLPSPATPSSRTG